MSGNVQDEREEQEQEATHGIGYGRRSRHPLVCRGELDRLRMFHERQVRSRMRNPRRCARSLYTPRKE